MQYHILGLLWARFFASINILSTGCAFFVMVRLLYGLSCQCFWGLDTTCHSPVYQSEKVPEPLLRSIYEKRLSHKIMIVRINYLAKMVIRML